MSQLDILNHKVKPPVQTMSYIFLIHCPMWFHRNLKISQTIAKAIDCSPQPDGKALLLKTRLLMSWNMDMSSWYLTPTDLCSW